MAGKLRITGGKFLRRQIQVPDAADSGKLRPTPDRVRAAVFSSLRDWLDQALVLDLFAGSGIHGFEAISRDALSVVAVELDGQTAQQIKSSAQSLGLSPEQFRVVVHDAQTVFRQLADARFDVVFVDPPYTLSLTPQFWQDLKKHLSAHSRVVFRLDKVASFSLPEGYEVVRERSYGGTAVFFLQLRT